MAQNKMEKDFSKKLSEREIQPSPMAWDRLDAMLAVSEEKKAAKKYNWLYVAAGFLGFLFIGTMLFTQTEEMTDAGNNEVVIENNSVKDSAAPIQKQEIINPVIGNKTENTAVASEGKKSKQSSIKTIISESVQLNENQINQNQINQDNVIAEQKINREQIIINQKTEQKAIKTSGYVNVDELLASVGKTENEKTQRPTLKVNPNSLLSQVDGELDLSFREKVIKAANKQYQTVRVAISNRNTQQ